MNSAISPVLQVYSLAKRFWPLILIGFALLDLGLVYTFGTSRRVSEGDFFIPWYATRQMVFEGQDPYSDTVTRNIQTAMAGAPFSPAAEDQLSFNYPLYTVLYLLPLTPFDYPLAEAIWNVINQFALVGAVWAGLRLIGWQNRPLLYRLLPYLLAFIGYPFIYTIAYGQYTAITLLFITGGALLLQRERFLGGGAILALGLFKPQTGLLVVAALMFWGLLNLPRRYKMLLSGGAVGLALLLVPMLWYADWPLRWLNQAGYRRLHPGMYSYNEELIHLFGFSWGTAITVGSILSLAVGLGLLWLWINHHQSKTHFPVLVGLTGLLTLLILPQYGWCNDIIYYLAGLLGLKWARERLPGRYFLYFSLGLVVSLYLPLLTVPSLLHAAIVVVAICWLGYEIRVLAKPKPAFKPANSLAADE